MIGITQEKQLISFISTRDHPLKKQNIGTNRIKTDTSLEKMTTSLHCGYWKILT